MYRVKNITHYSSSKIWATVAHGADVRASYPARAKSHETGLQSMTNVNAENAPRRNKKEKKKEGKSEKIEIPLQEIPEKAITKAPAVAAKSDDQKKDQKKIPVAKGGKGKKREKIKELIKNTEDVVTSLYHSLRRLRMTNDQRISDIIERWDTKQVDGQIPSVSEACLEASKQNTVVAKRTPKPTGVTPRIQKTFTVDESTVQFMDSDYREAYVCHRNPEQRPDSSMQQAILTSEVQPPKRPDVPAFRTHNKAQLVILITKDLPIPRRYFVANGPLGVHWIQTYLKGGDTFGILTDKEICEYEVPDLHIKRFKISFPGKALIADTRVKRQVFKPLDLDLDKIFAKKKAPEKIVETPAASVELRSNDNNYKEDVSDVNDGTGDKVDRAVQVNTADSKIYCDKAVQVDFESRSFELEPKVNQSVKNDANNNNIVAANDVEKTAAQECRKLDRVEQTTTLNDVKAHAPDGGACVNGIIGVKSDSEILDENWIRDLLVGSFPRLKERTTTKPSATVSEVVQKTDGKKNKKSIAKRFRMRLKRMFRKDSSKVESKKTDDARL